MKIVYVLISFIIMLNLYACASTQPCDEFLIPKTINIKDKKLDCYYRIIEVKQNQEIPLSLLCRQQQTPLLHFQQADQSVANALKAALQTALKKEILALPTGYQDDEGTLWHGSRSVKKQDLDYMDAIAHYLDKHLLLLNRNFHFKFIGKYQQKCK